MRKALISLLVLPALGGCAVFGNRQQSLDEFAVARNAPLVIPPDYTLTPPVAGTLSTSAEGAQSQAIEALFGGPAPRSAGEMSLLESAGRDRAMLGARSVVGDPDTRVVDKGAQTLAIISAPEADGQIASAQVPQ
jgi:hypothetical protein